MDTASVALDSLLKDLLAEFTRKSRRARISPDACLLHDLLILGDDLQEFWQAFDPEGRIDMTGFDIKRYFPPEVAFDTFLITVLSWIDRQDIVTRKYKKFPVTYLLQLQKTGSWSALSET